MSNFWIKLIFGKSFANPFYEYVPRGTGNQREINVESPAESGGFKSFPEIYQGGSTVDIQTV